MALSNLDDYPIHQTSEPMRHAATSDRNFYDRYYFNGFTKTGDLMFVFGLGVYPNLGVMDGFLLVHRHGQHRVVRASRALDGADRLHPSVGPMGVEVLEPLKRLHVIVEPTSGGRARMWGICDAAARFTYSDHAGTHVGYGLFETLVVGPHDQYGFKDLLDGYTPPA